MDARKQLVAIFRGGLKAADPGDLLQERLKKIPERGRLFVVGGGKAAAAMAAKIEEFYFDRIAAGCVAVKEGCGLALRKIEALEAGHPHPDERSRRAGERILSLLRGLRADDVVVALVSGGASALLAVPRQGSVEELAEENRRLLASGLPIQEVNRRRCELLALAAGGLARAAAPARVVSFILSDVVGDDLASVGSGPTVLDPPEPERVRNVLIGNNALAVGGASHAAKRFGLRVETTGEPLAGEAAEEGRRFARRALDLAPRSAAIAGGECTVSLGTDPGLGGRCQEAALAAALEIEGRSDVFLLFAGTDGSDGPTDAAGAFADGTTIERARRLGLDPLDFLRRHDAYRFFDRLDDLLRTGPTRTNVADLAIGIRAPTL